ATHVIVMTARPGRAKASFRTRFSESQDPLVGATTEFAAAKREILQLLRSEAQQAQRQEAHA
ncbi:hypothetical protein ABTE34_21970, partial [Acinetobacter baumannii]